MSLDSGLPKHPSRRGRRNSLDLAIPPSNGGRRSASSSLERVVSGERRGSLTGGSSRHLQKRPSLDVSGGAIDGVDQAQVSAALGNRRGSLKVAKEAKDTAAKAIADAKAEVQREHSARKANFAAFLRAHTVSELKQVDRVVEIEGGTSSLQAFDVLLEGGVMSAPVYQSGEHKSYTGFLDIRDLVSSIVYAYEQKESGPDVFNEAIVHAMAKYGSGAPVSVTYLSRRHPFRSVRPSDDLFSVASHLSQSGVHKVAVVDEDGQCTGIISQSVLLAFIAQHAEDIKADLTHTLADLKIGAKSVVSVTASSSALVAFATIDEVNMSGIAVVDEVGGLLGCTSSQDIKYFVLDKGRFDLNLPVMEYLGQIRQADIKDIPSVTTNVRLSSSLGYAIQLLHTTGSHRVFICDVESVPLGVFSITDLLRLVTDYGLN